MAATVCLPVPHSQPLTYPTSYPPINFFYSHFHNSIRSELDSLSLWVRSLEPTVEQDLLHRLLLLQERYQFLEQIYKYHSSVEDEVVYPALDAKVRNVTLAYSVEHQDEERLFDQLLQLLSNAVTQTGQERLCTIRKLSCKVEEINTTLRKHLSKEEEQLLPLLLQHFSFREQAELVAQFLYCIPLATVERVLSWLKPAVPQVEQQHLLFQIREVVADQLLLQLLSSWLEPSSEGSCSNTAAVVPLKQSCCANPDKCFAEPKAEYVTNATSDLGLCDVQALPENGVNSINGMGAISREGSSEESESGSVAGKRAPLNEIKHFHRSIASALHYFVQEVQALRSNVDVTRGAVASLVERHRFLRAVCMFHSISEDEVMFPALDSLTGGSAAAAAACHRCKSDHQGELALMEELGRLLADVRAYARRGRKEVGALVDQLVAAAQQYAAAVSGHMALEEEQLFPLLEQHLCAQQQRLMLWHSLRAMPLRLLERVMPWVVANLSEEDAVELILNMRLGAPSVDKALVELLSRWAERGRGRVLPSSLGSDNPLWFSNATCEPRMIKAGSGALEDEPAVKRARVSESSNSTDSPELPQQESLKSCSAPPGHSNAAADSPGQRPCQGSPASNPATCHHHDPGQYNPIDHIFQFHKALRQELTQLERDSIAFEDAVIATVQGASSAAASPQDANALCKNLAAAIQQLDGRFHFLWGIYRAHSKAEDEIVFPALESKEAAHNVSHAYTLDHQQEEQLFTDVEQVLERTKACASLASLQELSQQLRRQCAAVRASLEMHVRSEESELWPLFSEHFTIQEQQQLVGIIIGRTGAEVLQAMLPWVTGCFTEEESGAMMDSLREATKNTMFDQWLGAVRNSSTAAATQTEPATAAVAAGAAAGPSGSGGDDGGGDAGGSSGGDGGGDGGGGSLLAPASSLTGALNWGSPLLQDERPLPLSEVAQYLVGPGEARLQEASGTVAESSAFRPGWEDVFRLNQQQLEAAIRRVSNDPALEPDRKAYLMQKILTLKYIVTQQERIKAAMRNPAHHQPASPTNPANAGSAASAGPSTGPDACMMSHHPCSSAHAAHPVTNHPPQTSSGAGGSGEGGSGCGADACGSLTHRTFHDPACSVLGCRHYKRRCRLVAPCCRSIFTCRLCHDEAVQGHKMERSAVQEMVCMECNTLQPVAATCNTCHTRMARYYCNICHLFDDEPGRDIYHCPFCNVCRRGKGLGADFFHCMNCNACMSLSLFRTHKCREKCMEGNCPVCHEYLFDSSQPIKELPCGHFMHSSCFAAYTHYNYTCPICCKSIGDMSVYFQMLDTLLALERLPADYAGKRQRVLCHDCGRQSQADFHFVFHACGHCRSYNTRVL